MGRSVEVDDVIGMFGEDTCNARLVSFLNEIEMVESLCWSLSGRELGLA